MKFYDLAGVVLCLFIALPFVKVALAILASHNFFESAKNLANLNDKKE